MQKLGPDVYQDIVDEEAFVRSEAIDLPQEQEKHQRLFAEYGRQFSDVDFIRTARLITENEAMAYGIDDSDSAVALLGIGNFKNGPASIRRKIVDNSQGEYDHFFYMDEEDPNDKNSFGKVAARLIGACQSRDKSIEQTNLGLSVLTLVRNTWDTLTALCRMKLWRT